MNINILHSFTFSFATIRSRTARLTLLPPLAAFITGVVIASHTALVAWQWAAISLLSAILVFASKSVRSAARLLMFASLAATSLTLQKGPEVPLGVPLEMEISISEESSLRRNHRSCEARARCEGIKPFKIEVRTPPEMVLRRGDKFRVCTPLKPFTQQPTAYSKQMQRLGLQGVVYLHPEQISNFTPLNRPMLQHRIVDIFRSVAPPTQGRAIALAIGVGYRGDISREVADAYARCGLSHLLAVSGLHVAMIVLLMTILLRPLAVVWRGYELQSLVLIAAVWGYVWVCGMQPSAIRAGMLFTLLLLSRLRGRGASTMLNRLFLALMVMLLIEPTLLYDVGLQLSAIAVAAIMLYVVPLMQSLNSRSTTLNDIVAILLIGIVASLATQPLAAATFGKISFISILLNPIIVIFGYVALIGVQLTIATPQPLQEWVATITTAACDMLNSIVEWAASFGIGYSSADIGRGAVWAIYGGTLFATLILAGFRRRKEWNIRDI